MTKELTNLVLEQPKNGLFNSVKNAVGRGFRNILLTAMMAPVALGVSSLAGCRKYVIPNSPPTVSMYMNPTSGEAPLPVQIEVNGEDPDGKSDIVEYSAFADYNNNEREDAGEELVTQATPINMPYTFTNSGDFKVYGKVTDSAGHESITNLEVSVSEAPEVPPEQPPVEPPIEPPVVPPVIDYLDVAGRLEDCENDGIAVPGIIRVYDALDNTLLKTVEDDDGIFSFSLEQLVSELSNGIILQAATGTSPTNLTSYVRTVSFPQGDVASALVRVVPYLIIPNGMDTISFKQYMLETNDEYGNGLKKWNLNLLNALSTLSGGVEILLENPNPNKGSFTTDEQTTIRNKIQNSSDIRQYIEDRMINVQIDGVNNEPPSSLQNHYMPLIQEGKVIPDEGWIIVVPDNTVHLIEQGAVGIANVRDDYDREIEAAEIRLEPGNNAIISHEFGHVFIAPSHSSLSDPYTIMNKYPNLSTPGTADIKSAEIVNEKTYLPKERFSDILGTSFY